MAHELSFTNGKADFFSVGETAWHRYGTVLPKGTILTLDEALALAEIDYAVEKRGVSIDGFGTPSKKAFVTVRPDRRVELGAVGPDYTVVQNRAAFQATLGGLMEKGIIRLETGGVLRNGADAWLLGQMDLGQFGPQAQETFAGEIAPYVMVSVNHSGRRSNTVAFTAVRIVCANTLGMAETEVDGQHARSHSIRHDGDAEAKMAQAADKLFGSIVRQAEIVAESYKTLKAARLNDAQFKANVILPVLGAHPTQRKEFNPEARAAEQVIERYEAKGKELVRLWEQGIGHTGDRSAWEAYNGVVEAIDHNEDLFPARGGVYRTQGLMDGKLREMKDGALTSLVKFANEAPANRSKDADLLLDIMAETDFMASLTEAK